MSTGPETPPGSATVGPDRRRNLWIIGGLVALFLAMGLALLLFLLEERRRAAAGEYRGLENLFESPGGTPARAELRPRPAERVEGSAEVPLEPGS